MGQQQADDVLADDVLAAAGTWGVGGSSAQHLLGVGREIHCACRSAGWDCLELKAEAF